MDEVVRLTDMSFGAEIASEVRDFELRRQVRAVVLNEAGEVALLHSTTSDYYALPGGSVKSGESLEVAVRREVREETGFEVEVIDKLGGTTEERYFQGRKVETEGFLCLAQEFIGVNFDVEESGEEFELVWAQNFDMAIEILEKSIDRGSLKSLFNVTRDKIILLRAKNLVLSESDG